MTGVACSSDEWRIRVVQIGRHPLHAFEIAACRHTDFAVSNTGEYEYEYEYEIEGPKVTKYEGMKVSKYQHQ